MTYSRLRLSFDHLTAGPFFWIVADAMLICKALDVELISSEGPQIVDDVVVINIILLMA